MDPDAIWDDEWGQSRDGCFRWSDRQRGRGSFGVNLGHPIVTNKDFVP